jgi:hypothetical protein
LATQSTGVSSTARIVYSTLRRKSLLVICEYIWFFLEAPARKGTTKIERNRRRYISTAHTLDRFEVLLM